MTLTVPMNQNLTILTSIFYVNYGRTTLLQYYLNVSLAVYIYAYLKTFSLYREFDMNVFY